MVKIIHEMDLPIGAKNAITLECCGYTELKIGGKSAETESFSAESKDNFIEG